MHVKTGGWKLAATATTALSLALSCSNGESTGSGSEALQTLFESALSGQTEPVAEFAYQALVQHRARLTDEQLAIAEEVIRREFGEEKLEHRILSKLADAPQSEHLDAVLAWLETPLGQRVTKARVSANDPATLSEMKSFVEEKNAYPPSSERLALIERFNESALTAEISSSTVLFATLGATVMIDALQPADQRIGPEELRAASDARRQLVMPVFKEMSAIVYLLLFRDLSDEEIESAVRFTESEAGRWYYETTSSALAASLLETATRIGETYIAALRAKPSS